MTLVLVSCSSGPSTPSQIDPAAVVTESRTWVESSRPTPPNGGVAGAESRTLETRLWYAPESLDAIPCGASGCGVLLLAHGWGGRTARLDVLARLLAARGWIVAAPSFPLTHDRTPGGHQSGLGDLLRQPGDLSFVLDQLLAAAAETDDALFGRIDPARVGVIGHSLGGATAIGLTRHPGCTDTRFIAASLVAPAVYTVPIFGGETSAIGPPTLIVHGTADQTVAPRFSIGLYESIAPPKILVLLDGLNHASLIESASDDPGNIPPTAELLDAFFGETLAGGDDLTAALDVIEMAGHEVRRQETVLDEGEAATP